MYEVCVDIDVDRSMKEIFDAEKEIRDKHGLCSCGAGTCLVGGMSRDIQYEFNTKEEADVAKEKIDGVLKERGLIFTSSVDEVEED